MEKPIDIMDLKAAVRAGQIEFVVIDNFIYCRDRESREVVMVGTTEIMIKDGE